MFSIAVQPDPKAQGARQVEIKIQDQTMTLSHEDTLKFDQELKDALNELGFAPAQELDREGDDFWAYSFLEEIIEIMSQTGKTSYSVKAAISQARDAINEDLEAAAKEDNKEFVPFKPSDFSAFLETLKAKGAARVLTVKPRDDSEHPWSALQVNFSHPDVAFLRSTSTDKDRESQNSLRDAFLKRISGR